MVLELAISPSVRNGHQPVLARSYALRARYLRARTKEAGDKVGLMALLTDDEITEFLDNHSEWSRSGYLISRTFEFPDFVESIGFVAEVAVFAEKAKHHPDIDIRWNKVTLRLSTHSEGGLTHKDTDLADLCDALYAP